MVVNPRLWWLPHFFVPPSVCVRESARACVCCAQIPALAVVLAADRRGGRQLEESDELVPQRDEEVPGVLGKVTPRHHQAPGGHDDEHLEGVADHTESDDEKC